MCHRVHHQGAPPFPSCFVYVQCLFSSKYDDDVSALPTNQEQWTYQLNVVVYFSSPGLTLLYCNYESASTVPHGAATLPSSSHVSCLPMLSWLFLVHRRDLGLCPFSGLVCNLLLWGGRGLSPECALPEEYLGHNLDEHCLKDTGVVWCRTYPGTQWRRGFSPDLPRATWSQPNLGRCIQFCFHFFDLKTRGEPKEQKTSELARQKRSKELETWLNLLRTHKIPKIK